MQNKVIIQQTLHGYDNGHNLLASSIRLSRTSERTLLYLSDLSGPDVRRGYKSYITGYPLEDNLYALGRTWYADEMSRPGCVWTHTLIIQKDDVPRIKNFVPLLNSFVRPHLDRKINKYRNSIEVSSIDVQEYHKPFHFDQYLLEQILVGLYENEGKPVFVLSDESEVHEKLLLSVWNYQLPTLKQNFSFCSGSLENRKIREKNFDLQVIPINIYRHLRSEIPNGIFVEQNRKIDIEKSKWISTMVQIFTLPNNNAQLIDFLDQFGADFHERSALPKLVDLSIELMDYSAEKISTQDLIDKIGRLFPESSEGLSLKKNLLFSSVPYRKYNIRIDYFEAIKSICLTNNVSAYDPTLMGLGEEIHELYRSSKSSSFNLASYLISQEVNAFGESYLQGLSKITTENDVTNLLENDFNTLLVFLNYNPALAGSNSFWNMVDGRAHEVFDVIRASRYLNKRVVKKVVNAILESNINTLASDIANSFKSDAVEIILNWYLNHQITSEWIAAVQSDPKRMVEWIGETENLSITKEAFLITLLDPNSSEVKDSSIEVWIDYARKAKTLSDKNLLINTMAFLLILAFNNKPPDYAKIVEHSFMIVHDALHFSELNYHWWYMIEEKLPEVEIWRSWDRCERIRRGFVRLFVNNNWPYQSFLRSLTERDTLIKVLNYCNKSSAGERYLKNLKKEVVRRNIEATDMQLSVLNYY